MIATSSSDYNPYVVSLTSKHPYNFKETKLEINRKDSHEIANDDLAGRKK